MSDKVRERGIIMQGESVRAILAGRKTQTRRVVTPSPGRQRKWCSVALLSESPRARIAPDCGDMGAQFEHPGGGPLGWVRCPYGDPGDRLFVKEAWTRWCSDEGCDKRGHIAYRADASAEVERMTSWRSPLYLPRWASRITLEVVEVRVQRVQEISEQDAEAEGADYNTPGQAYEDPRKRFEVAWDWLNAKRGFPWASNPFVWAVTFKRVEAA